CSVWMAPGGSPARLGRILAPVDYSERSADALRVAAALAARAGLRELTALHVYFDTARVGFEGGEQVLEARQREEFDRFVAGLDTQGVAVIPRFVNESNAAHAITRTAGEIGADLIVLATRGRTRSASILL